MRDRLIELLKVAHTEWLEKEYDRETDKTIDEYVADYLLENGVIVPPCKVGDIVWSRGAEPHKVISIEWFSRKVTHLHCVSPVTNTRHTFAVGKRSLGKTVFLTREAAENALRKEDEGNE